MKLRTVTLSVVGCAIAFAALAARNNVVEEVAWMVGDQPIYKSEIEEAYQQMLYEKVPVDGDPYCVIPEQLAVEKLFLHQADKLYDQQSWHHGKGGSHIPQTDA